MKKNTTFLLVLLAIGLFIFLGIMFGQATQKMAVVDSSKNVCAVSMTAIIESAQGDVYGADESSESDGEDADYEETEAHYLAVYSVDGSEITNAVFDSVPADLKDEQQDTDLQAKAWDIFTELIPLQDRQMVAQYNVFTDGYSNTLAAVDQLKDDPSAWVLEMDIADLDDTESLLFTMVHEYAHLLTLNASQVTPDQEIVDNPTNWAMLERKAAACPNYFTGTGCSHADSYINVFYNRFWLDVADEWEKVDALQYGPDADTPFAEDQNPYYGGLHDFYLAHQDQFLDDYSTTHPAEDIAEAFAYFVFSPRPTGTSIKEQKVAFFYEYPELIELRESILSGACSLD